jgi:hypothetical protein
VFDYLVILWGGGLIDGEGMCSVDDLRCIEGDETTPCKAEEFL